MKRIMVLLAAVLCLACIVPSTAKAVVLYDNLDEHLSGSWSNVDNTHFWADRFGTGGDSYTLSSVTLLGHLGGSGSVTASIYTGGSFPTGFVGTLTSPGTYSSSDGLNVFGGNGITLSGGVDYWVVLSTSDALTTFYWTATDSNNTTGNGAGYSLVNAYSSDGGLSWHAYSDWPAMMKVEGSAVPLPAAAFLLGPGLVGLAAVRRRLKR